MCNNVYLHYIPYCTLVVLVLAQVISSAIRLSLGLVKCLDLQVPSRVQLYPVLTKVWYLLGLKSESLREATSVVKYCVVL